MAKTTSLPRSFFSRHTLLVARDLLGKRLVRVQDDMRISGLITETEAYRGEEDLACHARAGLTRRTQVMYGPAGHAYVYFTYGMHWLLNFITEEQGFPAAVLLRAIFPVEGSQVIASRRAGIAAARWTDGPAKVCQALGIDGAMNGLDLCAPGGQLFIEDESPIPDSRVTITPRVGLNQVPEPWKSIPWRYLVEGKYMTLREEQVGIR